MKRIMVVLIAALLASAAVLGESGGVQVIVNTANPLVYSLTRPTMSEIRPMRRSATVLPRTYAWVIQIADSASAPMLVAT